MPVNAVGNAKITTGLYKFFKHKFKAYEFTNKFLGLFKLCSIFLGFYKDNSNWPLNFFE